MTEVFEPYAVISGIARIMHPEEYMMGWNMLRAASQDPMFTSMINQWPSVFSAVSLVANRVCPYHREAKGDYRLFDILVSSGTYTFAPLQLQPLGFQIPNGPGTVVAFSGKAIRHGVGSADGHRICSAFYMRHSVQSYFRVRPCEWMRQEVYKQWVGPCRNIVFSTLSPNPFDL